MHSDIGDNILLKIQLRNFPPQIGEKHPARFFTRTRRTHSNADYIPIGHGTVSMLYGKQMPGDSSEELTDLKWAKGNSRDMKCYMRSQPFTLRNKVLLNGPSPEKARLVWFYPTSMPGNRYDTFARQWKEALAEIFGSKAAENIKSLPESTAPNKFYKQSNDAVSTIVNFDITRWNDGGGFRRAW